MILKPEDAKLFYDLMWALQFFVNQRLNIIDQAKSIEAYSKYPQAEKMKVREALFNQPDLITAFVTENPNHLPQEQLDIVATWRNFVRGDFYIERYLKNHAIFIGEQVYGVLGLTESFEGIIPKQHLPFLVKAILLPFKDCIIYDGLFESYNVYFGSGIKADLKERYLQAKHQDAIIVSLGHPIQTTNKRKTIKPKTTVAADWQEELESLTHIAGKLRGGGSQPRINSPVFSLVKASIALANTVINSPHDRDVLFKSIKKTERAIMQVEDAFYRMEDD